MTEPESMTQTRGKSGKSKAAFKRNKSDATSSDATSEAASREPQQPGRSPSTDSGEDEGRREDSAVIARIQQRAYWLYEASGFEEGHALEHWLEAERQVTGSAQRMPDKRSAEQS